jgi:hypothetical protein
MKIEMQCPLGILLEAESPAEMAIVNMLDGKILNIGARIIGHRRLLLTFPNAEPKTAEFIQFGEDKDAKDN